MQLTECKNSGKGYFIFICLIDKIKVPSGSVLFGAVSTAGCVLTLDGVDVMTWIDGFG